jgi:hypothetical protein
MQVGLTEAAFQPVYLRSEEQSGRWAVATDIVREVADLATARGVPLLVVMLPASYQVDTTIFRQYAEGFRLNAEHVDLDQPNRIMGERLRRAGVPLVDVLSALREAFAAGARPYGYVDRHFSPEGHAVVARQIEGPVAAALRHRPPALERARRSYR